MGVGGAFGVWRMGTPSRSARSLSPLGLKIAGPLRSGRDGPSHRKFFFKASGIPLRRTVDDGKWGSAHYYLSEADPPP